jgi:hypothetical protein
MVVAFGKGKQLLQVRYKYGFKEGYLPALI